MSRRAKNLAAAAAACAVLAWVVGGVLGSPDLSPADPSPAAEDPATPMPSQSMPAVGTPASDASSPTPEMREYALAAPEVDGLPPDLSPGTALELWVTWDPPLTKEPKIQRLVPRVVYERTIPPTIEGGPVTAVISLPVAKVPDLMYGDRYGALSVAVLRP